MLKEFRWYNPPQMYFGPKALENLAEIELPGKKAMIMVTPERFYVERVQALLKKNGVDSIVFDEVRPNPRYQDVDKAAEIAIKEGCDFVISIGGGSATDSAKGVAAVLGSGGSCYDYVCSPEGVPNKSEIKAAAPIIVISTTSGTGTEADQGAVIGNDELGLKTHIGDDKVFATISIIDPELQLSIPPAITAATGFDVICHAFEIFLAGGATPYTEMFCLNSLKYAKKYLVRAYKYGADDLDARYGMALASNMAGIAMSHVDTVSLHALSHSAGALAHKTPHGVALALFAEEWIKYYMEQEPAKFAILSETVGYGTDPEGFLEFIVDTLKEIDLDKIDLVKFGLDNITAKQFADHQFKSCELYHFNDKRHMTVEECEQIVERSFKKQLV